RRPCPRRQCRGQPPRGGRRPARARRALRRLPVRGARARQGQLGVLPAVPGTGSDAHRRRGRAAATARDRCSGRGTGCRGPHVSRPFVHRIRVRYAEVDGQGVVFNAHWLTYFDDACTRFMEDLGFGPDFWIREFDVMLVRAVVEWSGPARFDEWIDIAVEPTRLGTKSFDLHYRATVAGTAACEATITYVAVAPPTHESTEIPERVRSALRA